MILLVDTDPEPGDRVIIGGDIEGVVEELIFERGHPSPKVLVEWWQGGERRAARFHAEDCRKVEPEP